MTKWKPSKAQQLGPISKKFQYFIYELTELQEELDCPDEFIYDFLEVVRKRWSPDSCHAIVRKHKKNNADLY